MVDLTTRPAVDKPSLPLQTFFCRHQHIPSGRGCLLGSESVSSDVPLGFASFIHQLWNPELIRSIFWDKFESDAAWSSVIGLVDQLFMELLVTAASYRLFFFLFDAFSSHLPCYLFAFLLFSQLFTSSLTWLMPPAVLKRCLSHFNSNQSPCSAVLPGRLETEANLFCLRDFMLRT